MDILPFYNTMQYASYEELVVHKLGLSLMNCVKCLLLDADCKFFDFFQNIKHNEDIPRGMLKYTRKVLTLIPTHLIFQSDSSKQIRTHMENHKNSQENQY